MFTYVIYARVADGKTARVEVTGRNPHHAARGLVERWPTCTVKAICRQVT